MNSLLKIGAVIGGSYASVLISGCNISQDTSSSKSSTQTVEQTESIAESESEYKYSYFFYVKVKKEFKSEVSDVKEYFNSRLKGPYIVKTVDFLPNTFDPILEIHARSSMGLSPVGEEVPYGLQTQIEEMQGVDSVISPEESNRQISKPLENYRDKIQGINLFDGDEENGIKPDGVISRNEAYKYYLIMIDDGDGKPSENEMYWMRRAAEHLCDRDSSAMLETTPNNIQASAGSFYEIYDEWLVATKEERQRKEDEEVKAKIKEYEAAHPVKAEAVSESDFEEINR